MIAWQRRCQDRVFDGVAMSDDRESLAFTGKIQGHPLGRRGRIVAQTATFPDLVCCSDLLDKRK